MGCQFMFLLGMIMVMRAYGTTLLAEQIRHERLIGRLMGGARKKTQYYLDQITELWMPPVHMSSCFGGRVHWQVQPEKRAIEVVANYYENSNQYIRRAVLVALGDAHKSIEVNSAIVVMKNALGDTDGLVRLFAARNVAKFGLAEYFLNELKDKLGDPIWTVRWWSCVALRDTQYREEAVHCIRQSEPRNNDQALLIWRECLGKMAARENKLRCAGIAL